jgi:hypothetical protein
MMRRLIAVVCWVIAGHAVLAGLYYALLNVPESSIWMLVASAMLAVAIVVGALLVQVGGIAVWLADRKPMRAIRGAWRHVHAAVPGMALLALSWWATARADAWHAAYRGEIDAALMARFNWAETAWVHRTWAWLLFALRNAIALSLALAWTVAGVTGGIRALARPRWILRGLDPRAWGSILAAELLFIVLPWHFVFWRPESLPPTRTEAAFVAVKLAVIATATAIGWAIVLAVPVWCLNRYTASPAAPTGVPPAPPPSIPPPDGPLAA